MIHMYSALFDLYKGINTSDLSLGDIPKLIANIIQILLTLSAILATIFIIYAGIQYIASNGDPAKVKQAKSAITNAIAGLIISAAAYLLVNFIASQF